MPNYILPYHCSHANTSSHESRPSMYNPLRQSTVFSSKIQPLTPKSMPPTNQPRLGQVNPQFCGTVIPVHHHCSGTGPPLKKT